MGVWTMYEDTALMLACQQGHSDVARWLVDEKGCNVNATDTVGVDLWLRAALTLIRVVCAFVCVHVRMGHVDAVVLRRDGRMDDG